MSRSSVTRTYKFFNAAKEVFTSTMYGGPMVPQQVPVMQGQPMMQQAPMVPQQVPVMQGQPMMQQAPMVPQQVPVMQGQPMMQQGHMMPQQPPMQEQPRKQQRSGGVGTGAAVGLGVGALAAGGLAGYALGGGFSSDSPEHTAVESFSESADFGGDDWMD